LITIKKGQSVDFRGPKVPFYIKETKEAAGELAKNLGLTKKLDLSNEVCATGDPDLNNDADTKKQVKQEKETAIHLIWWNKIKKGRNAIHQEG